MLSCKALHYTVQYSTVLYSTVQYSTVLYSAVFYSVFQDMLLAESLFEVFDEDNSGALNFYEFML